jgi:hypothetical protein
MRKMRKRRRQSWVSLSEGGGGIARLLESAYFTGGILSILGGFLKIWVSFDGFWGPFSCLGRIFNLLIRYTRTEQASMYYSSWPIRFTVYGPSATAVNYFHFWEHF